MSAVYRLKPIIKYLLLFLWPIIIFDNIIKGGFMGQQSNTS